MGAQEFRAFLAGLQDGGLVTGKYVVERPVRQDGSALDQVRLWLSLPSSVARLLQQATVRVTSEGRGESEISFQPVGPRFRWQTAADAEWQTVVEEVLQSSAGSKRQASP